MYEVFIENRLIIFTDFKSEDKMCEYFDSNLIQDPLSDLEKMVNTISPSIEIYIFCSELDIEFKRIFEGFQKIIAGGGIVKRKERFLFIKRNGCWDIPKGKIEKGEKKKEGAIREIEEECGIKNPTIDSLICKTYHTYLYKKKPILKTTYWYAMSYDGPKITQPQLEEGITKVKWFKIEEIEKVRKNTFKSIENVLNHYF